MFGTAGECSFGLELVWLCPPWGLPGALPAAGVVPWGASGAVGTWGMWLRAQVSPQERGLSPGMRGGAHWDPLGLRLPSGCVPLPVQVITDHALLLPGTEPVVV